VVNLLFTADAVYWGCDCVDQSAALYKWDRTSHQVTQLMSKLNGSFYDGWSYNGQVAQVTAVEPSADGYTGDQFIHVLTNGEGSSWNETRTPFSRDQSNLSRFANPQGSTQPDSQGRFWVSYFDLAGSSAYLSANIEFQFDPTAKYNGVSSSFTSSPSPLQPGAPTSFDGSSSSSPAPPLAYQWNFGDGSTASGSATTTHTYASGGPFQASLQVTDANNDSALSTTTISAAAQPPTIVGTSASPTSNGATLSGSVNPNGSSTSAHFEYGTTSSYGSQTSDQNLGNGSAPQALSTDITGLQPSTTYHYRLDATNGTGTTHGSDQTFTTAGPTTSATTGGVTNLTGTSVTLNGTVNPAGLDTTVYFQYGTSTSYGSVTPSQDAGSATSSQPVAAALTGLTANTTYHYRLVAVNGSGTFTGADKTFSTTPASATTGSASFVSASGATLNATVNPNGTDAIVHFEYGLTSSYGSQTADQDAGSGSSAVAVSGQITGLQPNTTYHFRVDATGAAGTVNGGDATFTTGPGAPVTTTAGATGVSNTAATVNGSADPQGLSGTAHFEYGTDTSYGATTGNQPLAGNLVPNSGCETGRSGWSADGTTPTTFASQTGWASTGSASCRYTTGTLPSGGYSEAAVDPPIQGITAGTQYSLAADLNVLSLTSGQQVALYVTWLDSSGNGLGKVQVAFTRQTGTVTLSGNKIAPTGATQAQVVITVEEAGNADLYFDNVRMLASGTGGVQPMTAALTGLSPGTTYHYRIVATTAAGTSFGNDQTFTTGGGAPAAQTTAASGVADTNATLNGTVNPNGNDTNIHFEYGTDTSYGSSTQSQDIGSGTSPMSVNAPVTGLQAHTTYHYRVVATSSAGTTNGGDQTFTTSNPADTNAPSSSATAPAFSGTSTWGVSFTAADNSGGSGLASVELWVKPPGASGYSKVAADTTGSASGSFTYTSSAGQGTYSFYTVATDKAGNTEAAPSTPDATTVLDTSSPASTGSAPAYSTTSSWSVSYSAADNSGGSGLASVELWVKPPGASSYAKAGTDSSPGATGSISYTSGGTNGTYSFYTIAVDKAGNREPVPSAGDAATVLDTAAPSAFQMTNPGQYVAGTITLSPATTPTDTGSGLASVAYQYRPSGTTTWLASCTAVASPWRCTAGTTGVPDGAYELRALATDNAGNTTAATNTPLTINVLNAPPQAQKVQTTNVNGGVAGRIDSGDSVTFTYSEQIDPTSILPGWNGSSTPVRVQIANNSSNDRLTIWNSTGKSQLPITNPLTLGGNYVSNTVTFNAAMVQSGGSITITLGTRINGSVAGGVVRGGTLTWTPDSSATNLAGVACKTTAVTAAGPAF
jgi:phosphodiesterase/alkaline phosphatase D-like protein